MDEQENKPQEPMYQHPMYEQKTNEGERIVNQEPVTNFGGAEFKNQEPANNMGGEAPKKGLAITSLVMGIISIVCIFISWLIIPGILGFILGLTGMILGIISLKKHKTGIGIAGLVTSIIGFVLCLIISACVGVVGIIGFNTFTKNSNEFLTSMEEVTSALDKEAIKAEIQLAYQTAKTEYYSSLYSSKSLTDYFKDELDDTDRYYYVTGSDYGGWTVYVDNYTFYVSTSGDVTE